MRIRRNTVEFGYRDSFDHSTLSTIIANWLKNYRKVVVEKWADENSCIGVPTVYLPRDKDGKWIDTPETMEEAHIDRVIDLDLMIEAWEQEDADMEEDESITEWAKRNEAFQKKKEEGRRLFVEKFDTLWW